MSDAQFRRRFSNESKAITMLSQNNIVDVYGVCLEGDMDKNLSDEENTCFVQFTQC